MSAWRGLAGTLGKMLWHVSQVKMLNHHDLGQVHHSLATWKRYTSNGEGITSIMEMIHPAKPCETACTLVVHFSDLASIMQALYMRVWIMCRSRIWTLPLLTSSCSSAAWATSSAAALAAACFCVENEFGKRATQEQGSGNLQLKITQQCARMYRGSKRPDPNFSAQTRDMTINVGIQNSATAGVNVYPLFWFIPATVHSWHSSKEINRTVCWVSYTHIYI